MLADRFILSDVGSLFHDRRVYINTQASLVSLTTRIAVIVGDVLVLAVTWMKTAHVYREARRLNLKSPLVTMILRDGKINESSIMNAFWSTNDGLYRNAVLHVSCRPRATVFRH